MLKLEDLRAWLAAEPQGVAAPVHYNRMPDKPSLVVVLTDTGGFGMSVEQAMDAPTVQVRCRAPAGNPARDLAFLVDGLLVDSERPLLIGETYVIDVSRVGGRPAYLEQSDKGETVYTCNYRFESER